MWNTECIKPFDESSSNACLLNLRWFFETISHWDATFCLKYRMIKVLYELGRCVFNVNGSTFSLAPSVVKPGIPLTYCIHSLQVYFSLMTFIKCFTFLVVKTINNDSKWEYQQCLVWLGVVDRLVYICHLKSFDCDSTFRQWPHSQWCDFEGKGHGVENCNHSESLRWEGQRRRLLFANFFYWWLQLTIKSIHVHNG